MNFHRLTFSGLPVYVKEKSPALSPLRIAEHLIEAGDSEAALRYIDRAWRVAPECAAWLGPVYGKLLMDHSRNFDAALVVLTHAQHIDPTPETAAFIIRAYLALNKDGAAVEALVAALKRFAVNPDGALADAAHAVVAYGRGALPGWVGISPRLHIVGEIYCPTSGARIEIRKSDGSVMLIDQAGGRSVERQSFSFHLAKPNRRDRLQVTLGGIELVGGAISLPLDFDVDGRAIEENGDVSGWLRLGWAPQTPATVVIEDSKGKRTRIPTTQDPADPSRKRFNIRLRGSSWPRGPLTISALLPDGRLEPFPDSPLVATKAALEGISAITSSTSANRKLKTRLGSAPCPPLIDVVIPVYLGLKESLACIKSVLNHSAPQTTLVVIDDASPDTVLSAALDTLAAKGQITLLRNTRNIGFAASVNRGMQHHPDHDVVVLNADTIVPARWLERLQAVAYSTGNVGTVTPLSNDGSIVSYPRAGANLDAAHTAALDDLAATANDGLTADLPVGVGFCMFVRRACLDDVGELNHAIFGKGYGEETDFCLRATRQGWRHLLAANLFVLHTGGRSFGKRTTALQARSQRLLNIRHPHFPRLIRKFEANDPVQTARRRIAEAALRRIDGPLVLIISLALPGGVDRFVSERSAQLRQQGSCPLLLRPAAADVQNYILEVDSADVHDLHYLMPGDLPMLLELLAQLPIDRIEFHHFIGHRPETIEALMALPFAYEVYIHDYVWICPQITLIDKSGRYCGEPAVIKCERCIKEIGSNLGESISVAALRKRSKRWLHGARRVVAPSSDAAYRLQRYFPDLAIDIEALQPESPHFAAPLPAGGNTIRVALLGAIGQHKGYDVLLACAKDASKRRLPLEFIVIGYTQHDLPLIKTGRVFVTGIYSDAEAPHLLRRENPHVIFLPSVWPETWSYTLTHALGSGLPVASFDMGAIAERLQWRQRGYLLKLSATPSEINDRLLNIAVMQS